MSLCTPSDAHLMKFLFSFTHMSLLYIIWSGLSRSLECGADAGVVSTSHTSSFYFPLCNSGVKVFEACALTTKIIVCCMRIASRVESARKGCEVSAGGAAAWKVCGLALISELRIGLKNKTCALSKIASGWRPFSKHGLRSGGGHPYAHWTNCIASHWVWIMMRMQHSRTFFVQKKQNWQAGHNE